MNPPPPEPPDLDDSPAHPLDPVDVRSVVAADRAATERALLVETIHDPNPQRALSQTAPDDFTIGTHRKLWAAMQTVHSDGATLDTATVTDALDAAGQLQALGGWWGVVEVLETPRQFLASASWLAERVHERARLERLAAAGRKVAAMAANGHVDLQAVEDELAPLQQAPDRGITGPWDVRDQLLERLERPEALRGLEVGWGCVDRLYRVTPGAFTVITGIPGSGKSTWLDNVLDRMAHRHDWRIAVFSPESAPTARHVGVLAGIHNGSRPHRLDRATLDGTLDWIDRHFRWIESTDAITVTEVLRRADVIRHHFGRLDGLVIDPWNELDHSRSDNVTETQHISGSLTQVRRWGRKHDCHVWMVAHPKKLEKRSSGDYPPPTMYDISGSSTWHDKADMGVVVHRDKLKPGPVDVHVVKVRDPDHGRIGTAKLEFDVPANTYREAAA